MAAGMGTAPSEGAAGLGANFLPGVGDAVGLAQDAYMYASDPESRRLRNYLLTGLGALPFIPAIASLGKATRNIPTGMGNEVGAITYHGSPHQFDQFDMSKIGTGEGAQAYGHGLYFAENPKVAEQYAQVLGGGKKYFLNGQEVRVANMSPAEQSALQAMTDLPTYGPTKTDFLRRLEEQGGRPEHLEKISKAWDRLAAQSPKVEHMRGNIYHADLPDEQIEKMLDWDAPLSQQPKAFKSAVANLQRLSDEYVASKTTGGEAYRELAGSLGGQTKASEMLQQLGVPGIKYFDGGSRSAGQGTRNYVVFDDKLPKIIKRE